MYAQRLAVARMLFLIAEKNLRQKYCPCRRPIESFVDESIQRAMDEIERLMAED
jgi:hypothetical protein